ncbi:molybdopterin cofactor-binding domain-containing protein [Sphingomicrobium lutaoense]|uniref:Isoquinoline 1-oxidoreductase beta subunit n=1 Tax=Sphingomicrobium lutaoense TaxID=515949 RepID=A0A839Z4K7_9SPHN|nr:molybdopterin cofactor-binding domain-containing protein [Sphingomicrobium lutaoense]MBB3764542.1 isoquinoline 1-oxidoreductase beta subunit [Sphingomicrobium lutaoense]
MKLPEVDRRGLLIGGGVGAGLIVAIALWPRRPSVPHGMAGDEARFDHYLRIDREGRVTAALPQVETGQGIWTTLAGVIAAELGADPQEVAIEPALPAPGLENEVLAEEFGGSGLQVTAGASSIRAFEGPVRSAAATARTALLREASRRLDVPVVELRAERGAVRHGQRSVPFAELVEDAAGRALPRPDSAAPNLAKLENLRRFDGPAKAQGSWRFAADVRLPGMVHAAARLAPPFGSISAIDRARATERETTLALIERPQWVAALADTSWEAEQAIIAADIRVRSPGIDEKGVAARMQRAMERGTMRTLVDKGDADDIVDGSDARLGGEFSAHPFLHDTLEAVAACARLGSDGVMQVWSGSQAPGATRRRVAIATGLSEDKVMLIPLPAGGPDGRMLEDEAAPIAAIVAMESRKPVSLRLSHAHAARMDSVGPPMLARIEAVPSPEGRIAAWRARYVGAGGLGAAMARLAGKEHGEPDQVALVPPYGIPELKVAMAKADLPIRTGYRRGHAAMLHNFAVESTIDEVARAIGAEPLAFRISMLGGNVRLARLVQKVGQRARWNSTSMGLALASLDGSAIALIAEAEEGVDAPIVTRLVAAVDCGRAIYPDMVRRQVEAGLIANLQSLLQPPPSYRAAMPLARAPARPPALPDIDVMLVDQGIGEAGGVSSLASAVLAPAIANALVARGSKRLRALPFTRQGMAR